MNVRSSAALREARVTAYGSGRRRVGRASLNLMLAPVRRSADLTLNDDGAQLFAQALDEAACGRLETALAALPTSRPDVRIGEGRQLQPFSDNPGPIGAIEASVLGEQARPVRAILFDKTAERNWALGWHQDRTIVVKERMNTDRYGPWTVKSGLIQVEPPFEILERMVTLRVHLDAVDQRNAPLRIVPGSHRLGRLPEAEIRGVVATFGERLCLAERGDVFDVNTKIADGAFDFGVSQQDLNGAQIARGLVNDRRLGPPNRVSAILLDLEADAADPLVDKTSILPHAHVPHVVISAGKDEVVQRAPAALKPREYRFASRLDQLKLDLPLRLLLDDDCTISDSATGDNIADAYFHHVTSPQLAVDSEVEKCSVSGSPMLIEPESDCPDLLRFQRPFGANDTTFVPWTKVVKGRVHRRVPHWLSPEPRLSSDDMRSR